MTEKPQSDLIRTIDDEDEVENFSEDSDVEVEFQPTKQKAKKVDFNSDFQFVGSVEEYNKDTWNDLSKYVKRKAKTKTDDKIQKVRKESQLDEVKDEADISEDELKHDRIRTKEKKRKRNEEKEEYFENVDVNTNADSFYQMNLSRPLLKAVGEMKFVHPTPIQAVTVPVALLGKDICGCAATGTGKTAAYMLPTLERLLYRPVSTQSVTRVLVLVPTRELGVQIYEVTKQLSQFLNNLQIGLAVGGLDIKIQETILRKNPDIVIATPGRLIDHLKSTPTFSLDSIEILILDEADRMLDEYFAEQMKEIIKQCSRTRQTMLFSATMTDQVENLVKMSLKKPVRLFVDSNRQVAFNLRQEFVRIRADSDREAILAALLCRTFRTNCMVFVQTKKQAHRLHILLGLLSLKVGELHGNLTQPQRLDTLAKFKTKQIDVLVATDVAARGLDIQDVQTVINFVMPATVEHYIHRVGRTARAGRAGVSVSLAGEQERKIVKDVVKKAKNTVKSRVIPPDILEKYRDKLTKLEQQVKQILDEEHEERLLSKTENQVNRAKKVLNGEKETARPWFQTKKQRKEEKDKLSIKDKKKKKTKKKKVDDPVKDEVNKMVLIQAKLAKRKAKVGKINKVQEETARKQNKNKRKSLFSDDANNWDTSRKNVKKLRYDANFKKNKGNGGKSRDKRNGKSNTFGRPQQKKKR